jgi:tetratricopeptide (TPR) repeat protein
MMKSRIFLGLSIVAIILASQSLRQASCAASTRVNPFTEELSDRGNRLLENCRYQEALAIFERIIMIDPTDSYSRCDRALTLLCLDRQDEAIQEYTIVLNLDPQNIAALLGRSESFCEKYDYENALPDLANAARVDRPCHLANDDRSDVYIGLNKDEEAIRQIDRAIELSQHESKSIRAAYLIKKAEIEMRIGRFLFAEKDLEAGMKISLFGRWDRRIQGELLDRLGRHDEATLRYVLATMGKTNFTGARVSYHGKKNQLTGISSLRGIADDHSILGYCHDRLGNVRAAILAHDKAVQIAPKDTTPHARRGFSRYSRGDLRGAREDAEIIKELDSHDARARLLLTVLDAIENPGDAAYSARAFLERRPWSDPDAITTAIIGAIGAIRAEHREDADSLLDDAGKDLAESDWPKPILKYLKRVIDEKKLIDAAATPDQKSEAHAYLAVDLSIAGKHADAAEHLKWLAENGNKRSLSYDLAINELRRSNPELIAKLFPAPPAEAPRTKASVKAAKRKTKPTPTRKKQGNSR